MAEIVLLEEIGQPQQTHHNESGETRRSGFKEIWGTKNVHLLAFFLLIYAGSYFPYLSCTLASKIMFWLGVEVTSGGECELFTVGYKAYCL
jgi:hypothetical protein